ncbi:MAG: menaquinone reductase molybdopterin-binding-like subunit QrcB [Desulfatibacillaceae bacterium]
MKVDRRTFIKAGAGATALAVGGAVGTNFTPIPWKMTDDLSIWTQNWPWTPVPPKGAISFENTTCTLCPGGCGVKVRKADDRPHKIEGLEGHPVNNGGVCLLGSSGLQLLFGPQRVKTPLKRAGQRGEGRWQEISWEQAIQDVVKKLANIRKEESSHMVACALGSDQGTVPALFSRFMQAYGSPNLYSKTTSWDMWAMTLKAMHGVDARAGFDLANADFVLSFGCGLLDGWGSPVNVFQAHSKWVEDPATGTFRLVQIEPRLSNTACKAGQWIANKPGTEGALALAIANVLIRENLYDRRFARWHAYGFDTWIDPKGTHQRGFRRLVLEDYGPEKMAEVTGVDARTIRRLARDFAKAERPMAIAGKGHGDDPQTLQDYMAVHALNALVGNINKPGGVIAVPAENAAANWPAVHKDRFSQMGLAQRPLDGTVSPAQPLAENLLHRVFDNLADGKLEALLVYGVNPLYSLKQPEKVKKALDNVGLIVSFSPYLDDTATYADLVLPDLTYMEKLQDVPTPPGYPRPHTGLARPIAWSPYHEGKNVGDTIIEIARALDGTIAASFPWDDYEACLKEAMGEKWDALDEDGYWEDGEFRPDAWDRAFVTKSRNFEFCPVVSAPARRRGLAVPPTWQEVKAEGGEKDLPLLAVPVETFRTSYADMGDTPFMIKTVPDEVLKDDMLLVEINPETGRKYGLKDRKDAVLSTPAATVRVRIFYYEGIMPGLVGVPKGLGHDVSNKFLAGKGINYNSLLGPVEDPVTGKDVAWGVRARLTLA